MPRISMTDFVDAVSAAGTPKATKVKEIKHRPSYQPQFDYWKRLRDHIVDVHQHQFEKSRLEDILSNISLNKSSNYKSLITAYTSWWGRKAISWFEPVSGLYTVHGVEVSVNPELGLIINGSTHLIKLYFKAKPLAKNRIDIITHLMHKQLMGLSRPETKMSVLDIRQKKLISPTVPISGLDAMLDAELSYIAAIWPSL